MRSNSKSGLTRLPFSVIELNRNVHVAEKKNNERKSIEIFFVSHGCLFVSEVTVLKSEPIRCIFAGLPC